MYCIEDLVMSATDANLKCAVFAISSWNTCTPSNNIDGVTVSLRMRMCTMCGECSVPSANNDLKLRTEMFTEGPPIAGDGTNGIAATGKRYSMSYLDSCKWHPLREDGKLLIFTQYRFLWRGTWMYGELCSKCTKLIGLSNMVGVPNNRTVLRYGANLLLKRVLHDTMYFAMDDGSMEAKLRWSTRGTHYFTHGLSGLTVNDPVMGVNAPIRAAVAFTAVKQYKRNGKLITKRAPCRFRPYTVPSLVMLAFYACASLDIQVLRDIGICPADITRSNITYS